MGIFDFYEADPNIDNPKRFILHVIIFVVVVVLIVAGFRIFINMKSNAPASNTSTTTSSSNTATGTTANHSSGGKGVASMSGVNVAVGYDVLISYTDKGFSPATLQVKAGQSIRFVNKSAGTMRVMSVKSSNTSSEYNDFNQSQSVGKGGTFDFNFTRKGTWLYENLNNPSKTGVIVVY